MSFDRKQLVRKAFNILDATGDGKVSIDDIMQNYDFSKHPSVIGGVINTDGAAEEMLSVFEQGEWVEESDTEQEMAGDNAILSKNFTTCAPYSYLACDSFLHIRLCPYSACIFTGLIP